VIKAIIEWKSDRRVSLQVAQHLARGESVQEWREGDKMEMMNDAPLDLIQQADGTKVVA
jgi:hypothetical protein